MDYFLYMQHISTTHLDKFKKDFIHKHLFNDLFVIF